MDFMIEMADIITRYQGPGNERNKYLYKGEKKSQ